MVLAYHLILSCYGFWLPNDPRGSWSTRVTSHELAAFGKATKTDTRHSVAARPHDSRVREQAKSALRHPPVRFNGEQARCVARAFAEAVDESGYRFHAMAVMPDHAHLVVARHAKPIETIARHLKAYATRRLSRENLRPKPRSPWAAKHWSVFLDTHEHVRRAIRYVEENPVRAGLRPQQWKCVQPYTP
ncbi:MAG: transposase [Phycisphaeraceae bacterium]